MLSGMCAHKGPVCTVCALRGVCTQRCRVLCVPSGDVHTRVQCVLCVPSGGVHTVMQGIVCDLRGCVVCTGCALGSMCTQGNAVLCWPQRAVHTGVYETVCALRGCGQGCRVWKRRHSSSRILLRRGNEEVSFL